MVRLASEMLGRSPSPLTVQIPPESSDKPSWVKVGVIAVVGFAGGIAWPRLAGIRPGPSAAGEATAAAASASARAPDAPVASAPAAPMASASPAGTAPSTATSEAPVPLNNAPPAILVTRGAVVSCKTAEGEVLKGHDACGAVTAFDGLATPRLKKLAHCPGAQGLSGKLSAVFSLDFTRNKIGFAFGKNSTVGNRDSL